MDMSQLVLLTKEQYVKAKLNININLIWVNINNEFVGPYTYTYQLKFIN